MSSRGRNKPPALSPEESRYLDGQLPPEEARRFERSIAADPARADALASDREAMDLWRDDAARASAGIESGDLADRVLADIEAGAATYRTSPAGRWYAMAAAALILIGVAGTAVTRAQRTPPPAGVGSMETQVLEAFISDRVVWPTEDR